MPDLTPQPLTRPFDETVYARVRRDPEFAVALVKGLEAEIKDLHARITRIVGSLLRGLE